MVDAEFISLASRAWRSANSLSEDIYTREAAMDVVNELSLDRLQPKDKKMASFRRN